MYVTILKCTVVKVVFTDGFAGKQSHILSYTSTKQQTGPAGVADEFLEGVLFQRPLVLENIGSRILTRIRPQNSGQIFRIQIPVPKCGKASLDPKGTDEAASPVKRLCQQRFETERPGLASSDHQLGHSKPGCSKPGCSKPGCSKPGCSKPGCLQF